MYLHVKFLSDVKSFDHQFKSFKVRGANTGAVTYFKRKEAEG